MTANPSIVMHDSARQAATLPPFDVESPAFLRRMASLVPGIIYVFNHDSMSNEYSNRSIAELLGYTPQELVDMGDRLIEKCVHEDDLPQLVAYFQRLVDVPDGEYSCFEYRDYAKNGDIVWLRSIDTPFERADDGSLLRHVGIAFDITAQKTAELKLRQLNAELEQRVEERTTALAMLNNELESRVAARTRQLSEANKELEQLSYIATHDLKVPINNMISLARMLGEARENLPPEHVETLDWMHLVCEQASQKLEALVTVAQANTMRDETFEAVDLQRVLDRVLETNRDRIERAGAEISVDFACSCVNFPSSELEVIFEAMLLNAIGYRSADRALRIVLRSFRADKGIMLTVADNGSGFDMAKDSEKVFGLFQRAHLDPPGAGVSLYAVRRMLKQIGGAIEAESHKDRGTVFTLRFPIPEIAEAGR